MTDPFVLEFVGGEGDDLTSPRYSFGHPHSLRGTMCLVYPPSYRARLVIYIALICNETAAPAEGGGNWVLALELGDKQRLKGKMYFVFQCRIFKRRPFLTCVTTADFYT